MESTTSRIAVDTLRNGTPTTVSLWDEYHAIAGFDCRSVDLMWRPDQIEEWEAQFPETHVQNLPDDIAFLIDQHKAGIDPVIRASLTGKQQAEMILPIRLLRWLEFVETFHHTYKRVSQKKPPKGKSS